MQKFINKFTDVVHSVNPYRVNCTMYSRNEIISSVNLQKIKTWTYILVLC